MHPTDPGHPQNRPRRALSIPLRNGWTKATDGQGWTTYTRGNCRISDPPATAYPAVESRVPPVMLYAPGCASAHSTVDAAKRAAARSHNRGW